jgi:hypothetical protein
MTKELSQTTIVEINGVKMEIDLRHATVVHQNLRVGSKVKVLHKPAYGDPVVYPGVIVGFEMFPSLPTIIVSYIKTGYNSDGKIPLEFAHINTASAKSWELVPSVDDDLPIARDTILEQMDRALETALAKVDEIQRQRAYFLKEFGAYFAEEGLPEEVI